eukprot:1161611-Pelagomonas_calceolata.AAC.5
MSSTKIVVQEVHSGQPFAAAWSHRPKHFNAFLKPITGYLYLKIVMPGSGCTGPSTWVTVACRCHAYTRRTPVARKCHSCTSPPGARRCHAYTRRTPVACMSRHTHAPVAHCMRHLLVQAVSYAVTRRTPIAHCKRHCMRYRLLHPGVLPRQEACLLHTPSVIACITPPGARRCYAWSRRTPGARRCDRMCHCLVHANVSRLDKAVKRAEEALEALSEESQGGSEGAQAVCKLMTRVRELEGPARGSKPRCLLIADLAAKCGVHCLLE